MKLSSLLLIGSLVANAALVAIFVAKSPFAASTPIPHLSRAPDDDMWKHFQSDDLHALVANLRAADFPPSIIHAIIAAQVSERFATQRKGLTPPLQDGASWQLAARLDPKKLAALRTFARKQRNLLKELLGSEEDLGADEELRAYYQRRKYGNLPVAKLDQLEFINQDYAELAHEIYLLATHDELSPEERQKLVLLDREKRSELASLLTPQELEEYQLHNSPTANTVRLQFASQHLTEAEFRAIFKLQQAYDGRFVMRSRQLTVDQVRQRKEAQQQLQAQIKIVLGNARYSEYAKTRDPNNQLISHLVSSLNLPPEATAQVLSVQKTLKSASTLCVRIETFSRTSVPNNFLRSPRKAWPRLPIFLARGAYSFISKSMAKGCRASSRRATPLSRISRPASRIADTMTFTYGYLAQSSLVSSLTTGSFTASRTYESHRNLLTSIQTQWSASTLVKYDYISDVLGRRDSVKQSGSLFADYGGNDSGTTFRQFAYNDRNELGAATDYLGTSASGTLLSNRNFSFAYDAIGNRQSSNYTGIDTLRDDYTVNNLNQYVTRENNTVPAAGMATDNTAVKVAVNGVLAGRQRGFWACPVLPDNVFSPASVGINVFAAWPGHGNDGQDVKSSTSTTAMVAQALQFFTYDADGNLISDGVWDYQWDAENRLVRMATTILAADAGLPDRTLLFQYDYLGRRVQKRVFLANNDGNTEVSCARYLYYGNNLIAEYVVTDGGTTCGSLVRSYAWGLDLAGSLSTTGGVGALVRIVDYSSAPVSYLPAYDGNGNVTALLNAANGSPAATYEYSPFGELLRAEGDYAASNPFRFSTKFQDQETGLVYYGSRYYSPGLGRFLNRDPIEEGGGINLYGFCGNDGINGIDYLGDSWLSHILREIARPFEQLGHAVERNWKPIVAIAIGVVTAGTALWAVGAYASIGGAIGATFAGELSVAQATLAGAAFGFGASTSGARLNGASWGTALTAGVKGAVIGGITGGTLAQLGQSVSALKSWTPFERYALEAPTASTIVGLSTASQGGKFMTGFEIAFAAYTAQAVYKAATKYSEIDPRPGAPAQPKGDTTPPREHTNNIGAQGRRAGTPPGFWDEGGTVSNILNHVPGVNAVAGLHDYLQTQILVGGWQRIVFNVPGMIPAGAVTYAGLAANAPEVLSYGQYEN